MNGPRPPLMIPSLDGIRAASFLLVFLAHAGLERAIPGGLGVTVFFFLSGFLITTLLRKELEETGGISLKQFYLRRALRIFPPFYTMLLGAAALSAAGVLAGPPQGAPLLAQVLHLANYWTVAHGYEGQIAGTGVYWSLAVEEHYYLVFPALFVLLHRLLKTPLARAASLCALAGNPALDTQAPGIQRIWLRVLLPSGAALMLVSLLFRDDRFRETFRYTLQGVALYPLFVCAVRHPRLGAFRLLNHALVRRVGELSYSLYLVHHVVILGVQRWLPLPGAAQGAVALGLALLLSDAIWRFVEQPCARLRKRLTRMPAPALAAFPAIAGGSQ